MWFGHPQSLRKEYSVAAQKTEASANERRLRDEEETRLDRNSDWLDKNDKGSFVWIRRGFVWTIRNVERNST